MSMAPERVYIGIGSNLGDRFDHCHRAITLLRLLPATRVTGVSSLYETEPVAGVEDPGPGWFLNAVVRLETEVGPHRLLEVCREIERALGRDSEHRGGPRTLDLDILLYGTRIIRDSSLAIPHPRFHLRRFVLTPLVELDPAWEHPGLHRTFKELLEDLADPSEVRRMAPPPPPRDGSRPTCSTGFSGA